ncbi:hypothetical protein AWR36_007690 [Microbulbifer flavimaris]|uniref:Transglutaminase-like domain-containing protein n=1 Tax=Microbulbifer flavimaris TaxID=1781068 RepID=A0ABX4I0F4_9GAMM|nr:MULTISPECIES: transglutaminase domain-containing protein [Microbulbifer]KUJ83704.1 hypothetical protein AVO43_07665 [Microbulbifer sp. ZGT114]PCO05874.1 hypothetical protein AWR36_007690 [Microbulbifer flavimaris]
MIRICLLLATLFQVACASNNAVEASRQAGIEPAALLQAPTTLLETANEEGSAGNRLFLVSEEMRSYLRSKARGNSPVERMNAVLQDLKTRGAYLQYDLNRTTSAAEAFAQQQGNCVSHAAMIVAMARHVGLEAYVNQGAINSSSQFSESDSGVRFRQNVSHINAVVVIDGRPFIIEQDYRIYHGKNLHRLSDREAKSLYLNNLAMEAMLRDEMELAFVHMRNAINLDDDSSVLWGGLGTVYRRLGAMRLAQQSFIHALNLNPQDGIAQNNLRLVQNRLQTQEAYADSQLSRNKDSSAPHAEMEIQLLAQ